MFVAIAWLISHPALAWIVGYLLIAQLMYWWQDEDDQEHLRKVPLLARLTLLPVMVTALWLTLLVGLWPYFIRRRRRVQVRRVILAINELRERHRNMRYRVRVAEAEVERVNKRLAEAKAEMEELATRKAGHLLNTHWLDAAEAAKQAMVKVFTDKTRGMPE